MGVTGDDYTTLLQWLQIFKGNSTELADSLNLTKIDMVNGIKINAEITLSK